MYPLLVACKSINNLRKAAAQEVVDKVRQQSGVLVDQAQLVSNELIRVAILWHEMWHEALEEASRLYFGENNIEGMLKVLEPLHEVLEEGAMRNNTTIKERAFIQAYHHELLEAYECCMKYKKTGKDAELTQSVSPELVECQNLELAVPGTYQAVDGGVLHVASGKILHIDFGDCFEASMNREKVPEKAFVQDPLINWRLFNFNEVPQISTIVGAHVPPVVNSEEIAPNGELLQPQQGAREREQLQVVLNQAQFDGLCNGLGKGLQSLKVVNSVPHVIEPSMNNVGEVQHAIIEAQEDPRPNKSIPLGLDKGMKAVGSHVRVNPKNLPIKRKDKGKNVVGSSAGEQVDMENRDKASICNESGPKQSKNKRMRGSNRFCKGFHRGAIFRAAAAVMSSSLSGGLNHCCCCMMLLLEPQWLDMRVCGGGSVQAMVQLCFP
ncbi:Serine/threonine-protein kinase TOR [Camellia lanceoleosa]|uniref:Serine/threonine-protein kinase TOR n=1 Tax=Camellia lanceoleosa TaxID=1840588 RepID=A0ACC0FUE6_9ERIC|nr:Serine/threonine-protein kinase TOR [Camellia lanceoleosa]